MIPLHYMRFGMTSLRKCCKFFSPNPVVKMTAVGFEPTPLRTGA